MKENLQALIDRVRDKDAKEAEKKLGQAKKAAQTTIIQEKCPHCGKIAKAESNEILRDMGISVVKLKCGHSIILDLMEAAVESQYDFLSSDGKSLFEYQKEGIKFIEQANGRALIADEMGLGKTVQALGFLKLHADTALPAIIICKSRLTVQWMREALRWCGPDFMPLMIGKGEERPLDGFPIYIISFDLIRRVTGRSRKSDAKKLANWGLDDYNEAADSNPLAKFAFKTVIIDETQQIKNSHSIRTQEVRKIAHGAAKDETGKPIQREYIIGLSGTAAKNNAGEMFSILNMLNPLRFPSQAGFIRQFCDQFFTGRTYKVGGIRDFAYFQTYVSDIILRRERKDVLKELPEVTRRFFEVELEGKKVIQAYVQAMEEFNEQYGEHGFGQDILAMMSKLRHIAGLAKVQACVDKTIEFLQGTNRKLVIFTHHVDVAEAIEHLLNKEIDDFNSDQENEEKMDCGKVINLVGKSPAQSVPYIDKFKDDPTARVMIASTLASGEGLNLQFVSDAFMIERQWNPANEKQAEDRFPRPGRKCATCFVGAMNQEKVCQNCGAKDFVNVTYFLVLGTIDEFFTEIVEQKRGFITSIHQEIDSNWNTDSLMKQLAEALYTKGLKRWRLK